MLCKISETFQEEFSRLMLETIKTRMPELIPSQKSDIVFIYVLYLISDSMRQNCLTQNCNRMPDGTVVIRVDIWHFEILVKTSITSCRKDRDEDLILPTNWLDIELLNRSRVPPHRNIADRFSLATPSQVRSSWRATAQRETPNNTFYRREGEWTS